MKKVFILIFIICMVHGAFGYSFFDNPRPAPSKFPKNMLYLDFGRPENLWDFATNKFEPDDLNKRYYMGMAYIAGVNQYLAIEPFMSKSTVDVYEQISGVNYNMVYNNVRYGVNLNLMLQADSLRLYAFGGVAYIKSERHKEWKYSGPKFTIDDEIGYQAGVGLDWIVNNAVFGIKAEQQFHKPTRIFAGAVTDTVDLNDRFLTFRIGVAF